MCRCECASVPKSVETARRNNELPQLFALALLWLCELCVRKEAVLVVQLVPSLSVSAGAENSVGALNPSSPLLPSTRSKREKLKRRYWTQLHLFPQTQETNFTNSNRLIRYDHVAICQQASSRTTNKFPCVHKCGCPHYPVSDYVYVCLSYRAYTTQ
jgi:hypothetical protein